MSTPAQRLTAHFVDECAEQGRGDLVRQKGHFARRAKELLDIGAEHPEAGITEENLRTATTELVRRNMNPIYLDRVSLELAQEDGPVRERPSARRAASEWIKEHGWPTGARFVRGTHAGSYVYDPLGLDRITESGWPYPRPTFDDVAEALAARD